MWCLVKDCVNTTDLGHGVRLTAAFDGDALLHDRWVCLPCWLFMTKGEGKHAQVIRNACRPESGPNYADLLGRDTRAVASMGSYRVVEADGKFHVVDGGFSYLPIVRSFSDKYDLIAWVSQVQPVGWKTALGALV